MARCKITSTIQALAAVFVILSLYIYLPSSSSFSRPSSRSFTVDYHRDLFLRDGQQFDYVSGSLHYFRVPHQLWRDRLLKLRAAGINVVSTYVAWNWHEPHRGQFRWEGDADLVRFVKTAAELGLLVNIRPGPYICAEWELGGIPSFVLGTPEEGVVLRSSDSRYLAHVERWFSQLLPRLVPLLYRHGGPVIMVQVENEYGSHRECDKAYMTWLMRLMRRHLGKDTVLYTADGWDLHHLTCGPLHSSDSLTTLNFGPNTEHGAPFARLRGFQGHGPLVNSEYYPGWLDHWGEKHQCKSSELVTREFEKMLNSSLGNVYVNFYMFFGGTNFGFYNGANSPFDWKYQPDPTSYDYDAPLSESGELTPKYHAIRDTIKEHRPQLVDDSILALVQNSTKKAYGTVTFDKVVPFTALKTIATRRVSNSRLLTFEELRQDFGFVLYEKQISSFYGTIDLEIPKPRDMVYVFADDKFIGKIYRSGIEEKKLSLEPFTKLSLLVENMGRINYGAYMHDYKGILGDVQLGDDIISGSGWEIWTLPLNNTESAQFSDIADTPGPGSMLRGSFVVSDSPADTWVSLAGWGKGVIFVNGRNMGRYWPSVGPQINYYIPGVWLKTGVNEMILFETEGVRKEGLAVELVDYPDLGRCANSD